MDKDNQEKLGMIHRSGCSVFIWGNRECDCEAEASPSATRETSGAMAAADELKRHIDPYFLLNRNWQEQVAAIIDHHMRAESAVPEASEEVFEAWWESQGLDGEQVKARDIDRWTLAKMAFDAGRALATTEPDSPTQPGLGARSGTIHQGER